MIYAISTGVVTSAVAISVIIVLILQPSNLIYLSIFEAGANLYAVSVLARLNSRTPKRTSSPINIVGDDVESNFLTTFRAAIRETGTNTAETSSTEQSSGKSQAPNKLPAEMSGETSR
ncbi:hypothetical protein E1B28_011986 [Marasmius oreades]|uniref:DUF6534 domain-containing protein n=1 Tax=Marasmius oreades TaxID=181124 RepID=A0A9P7RQQ1_9AGAR|nr:uncharacterized protein E1B28_011986 [Marasmius oreades]KAG7087942.1 hypothetical protein E1B28_011986 [Marasmius oreades]